MVKKLIFSALAVFALTSSASAGQSQLIEEAYRLQKWIDAQKDPNKHDLVKIENHNNVIYNPNIRLEYRNR